MSNHLKYKYISVSVIANMPSNRQPVQQSITAFRTPIVSKDRWQRCTKKLAAMCATDLRPISICEGRGLREFCKELNPGYTVASKTTMGNYLHLLYHEETATLVELVKIHVAGAALTTDIWTSLATGGYLTLTCHFIKNDWKFTYVALATRKLADRHTGENTANKFRAITGEYGLHPGLITALVTDDGSNMPVCAQNLDWLNIRRFGHTLQPSI